MRKYFFTVLLIALTCVNMYANSIATVTKVDKYVEVKLPAPYNLNVYAGTFLGTVGGSTARFYCIDLHHSLVYNSPYQDVSATSSKITYILNNYYPFKTLPYQGALAETNEAAAVQLAIWSFTDQLNIPLCVPKVNADAIRNRALAIAADANQNAGTIQPFKTLVINIPSQSFKVGTPVEFYVETYNEVGAPVSGAQVNLSVNEGTLSASQVTTNAAGVGGPVTLNAGPNNSTIITAQATVTIPGGTQYYNVADPDGKQKLVIATPVTASKTVSNSVTWYKTVSLAIAKTSATVTVKHGDAVSYQISVTNTSDITATGVKITDILPALMTYVSCDGDYNPSTGIWNAGTINAGETKTLTINVNADFGIPDGALFSLGAASDFNLFVLNDLKQPSSDTQGKVAVGHDAELYSYSVGDVLPPNSGYVLVAGRKLTYKSGRVYGDIAFGSFIDTTHWNLSDGVINMTSPVDFNAASLYLNNLSSQLSALEQNGTTTFEYGGINLSGTNPDVNRFTVSGSDISACNNFLIDVPENSTVLINVTGDNIDWSGGFQLKGATNANVLINFFEATEITISGIDIKASVLAPKATLNFPAGLISGQVIAYNVYGSGQFNWVKFIGKITLEMTITNVAELLSVDQPVSKSESLPKAMARVSSVSMLTGVKDNPQVIPTEMGLLQNYPNPFNPSTIITFEISESGNYSLKLFNSIGEEIAVLSESNYEPGSYSLNFTAGALSSGIYFYQLKGGNTIITKKMILAK